MLGACTSDAAVRIRRRCAAHHRARANGFAFDYAPRDPPLALDRFGNAAFNHLAILDVLHGLRLHRLSGFVRRGIGDRLFRDVNRTAC